MVLEKEAVRYLEDQDLLLVVLEMEEIGQALLILLVEDGGGWYGGGSGNAGSGGGGSGYVYTSATASNYPSGCLLNSSYYLTNAATYAGNTSFVSPTGGNETGHSGNGYARITLVE